MWREDDRFACDTVTLPTQEMRQAMFNAEVGDAGYGEDPTLNRLEKLAAEMLGKEDAAFVSSGCQGNLTALLAHCPRGHEVVVGDRSDLYDFEAGSVSVVGGLVLHPVPTETDGRLSLDNLRSAIRDKSDYQCAQPGVIVLENPHCQRGGRVLPESYIKEVRELADERGQPLHLDGARIFNAAIASKRSPAEMAKDFDSIMVSLSKGLAAPFGSVRDGDAGSLGVTISVRYDGLHLATLSIASSRDVELIDSGCDSVMSVQSFWLCTVQGLLHPIPAELPMKNDFIAHLSAKLAGLKSAGLRARLHLDARVRDQTRGWYQGSEFLRQQLSWFRRESISARRG
ncbi:threonine aldolase family protein [Mesorhizobium australicum]|uniref:threonine aldolase family protein n=1 Tax=Mesorhizobium australicum TaxID=536018 RepID=UPI0033376C61